MNLNLENKNALVCGSSQGMGKAIAIQLAEMGANVTLFARNLETLNQVKAELANNGSQEHFAICADFSKPEEVARALDEHLTVIPEFQILINNTGGPAPGPASRLGQRPHTPPCSGRPACRGVDALGSARCACEAVPGGRALYHRRPGGAGSRVLSSQR